MVMLVALHLTSLLVLFKLAASQTKFDENPLKQLYLSAPLSNIHQCGTISNLQMMCKIVRDSNQFCVANPTLMLIYASWQQNEKCRSGFDYYERSMQNLQKQSALIYNITQNWTVFFDNRANNILNSQRSAFVCSFAAKRWKQINEQKFFDQVWRSSAIKCSNYLVNARRAMMCAMCNKDDQPNFSTGNYKDPRQDNTLKVNATQILLNFQTCQDFLGACQPYIEQKQYVNDRLNVEFTLGLCDKDGTYLASSNKASYKRVLPTMVVYEDEEISNCNTFFNKGLALSGGELEKAENSCKGICERYFSLSPIIWDDLNNLDALQNMHDILKEIVMENFHPNLFVSRSPTKSNVILDMHEVIFKFGKAKTTEGLDLERHVKDNEYSQMDVSLYIKNSWWFSMSVFICLAHWMIVIL